MKAYLDFEDELKRAVDASIDRATSKILSCLQTGSQGPKEWFTNREAMDFLGLSKTTLQRYRASGQLPFSKVGGNIYYRYEDVVRLLEDNVVK